ncbi:retrotransposon protein, putative, ty1-copia subclass [Tanacetum coccineum]
MFEREKLFGTNFNDWFRSLKLVLRVEKKLFVIEQPISPAPVDGSTDQAFVENAIFYAHNKVACLMLGSMTPELHKQFETFHACKQEEGKPVSTYVLKLKGYVEQRERLSYVLPQDLSVGLILNGLTSDFVGLVKNYNMHNMGKTIGKLHALLIEYEKGLPKKDATPQRNFPAYLAELIKKKKQVGTASSLVSKNNVLYFNVIPSNGIYEIDMLNLVLNVNSIHNVSNKRGKHNLDSTYSWHYHLAHISKKCIEKLQHDRLLKSMDEESFDKCVSCLSGKMIRKPFPHCTERATDLLGLIHTDVCGPLRYVSRQDTSPSENTSEIPMEVEGFEPPQEEVILIRRSARTHQAPEPLCLNIEWLDAMNVEMQSMKDNQVLCLVDLLPNAIAAFYDYEIWQMDVKTTFLNGYLDKDIYMVEPEGALTPEEVKWMQNVPYDSTVGSIMYAVRCTRLDVEFANTKDTFLVYGGNPKAELRVDCYCDAGFETDRNEIKSQTRYVFVLNGGAVDWKSSNQSTTAMSATEATYIAASKAAMEAVWIRKLISRLGIVPTINKPIKMFCDNSTALLIANEPGVQREAIHYHRRYHYVRECVVLGEINLLKVHTYENLVDPFTKALLKGKLTQCARSMGLCLSSNFM